jgi:hypothetical protein
LRMAWAAGLNSLQSSSAVRPARTSSIICRRNSGGYCLRDFPVVDSFRPNDFVSAKPGQLHSDVLGTLPARDAPTKPY